MLNAFRLPIVLLTLVACTVKGQDVAYEKYKLDNGMTVILHEDKSVPAACINLWYYVGAKDEPQRRSGFAHLFEHLMFMGTERVPGLDFDNIMEAGGGYNNASTSEDRTNYFSMGPSELLPKLLWLDADRLEDLGRMMTQEKLDKQRDVVRNERRQSYENRPYGKADLRVHGMMFPKDHPYHIPVIGTHEDLESATVDDVKNFFATYYVPSNASLVVAGDFDPNEIKPLINRIYGTLPRGSDVVHASAEPVTLSEVKRLTMTDTVQFARTTMVYHSPRHFDDGDAEMDLAAAVLSDGISSRLYQKLVYQDQLAVDVSAYQASMLLGSLFYIEATAKPGVDLDRVERAIDEALSTFVKNGPTREELDRQKAKLEHAMMSRLQSILGKANRLNTYEFYYGEPNSFKRDLDRYRNATAENVRRWSERVFTPDARLIQRVIPELEKPEVNPRNESVAIDTPKPFEPLTPETFTLSNGIKVHHWPRRELPLVELTLLLQNGTTSDPVGKAGLATLTTDMLDEGAGQRDAIQFADALDQIGAGFGTTNRPDATLVSLSCLSRTFGAALDLFTDAVLNPRFDEKEWTRVHSLHVQNLARLQDRPTYVARTVAMQRYFGDGHPYSRPGGGTPLTALNVTLDDVKRTHLQRFRPSSAVFLVAGDLPTEQLRERLERKFGSWRDPTGVRALERPSYPSPAMQELTVAIVDRPGAVQTVIQFTMPGPVYADPTRPKLQLFNTILGGSFTSRLNKNLREIHGYSYGARSNYVMDPFVGYFTASSNVRADVTGASIGEFLKEFGGIRGGNITSEEARKARASRRMRIIQSFAGLRGILGSAATLVRNKRPFTDLGEELQAVASVTENDLNRLAYNAVPQEKGLLLLVGDKKLILEQLKEIDLPKPIELNVMGQPVDANK